MALSFTDWYGTQGFDPTEYNSNAGGQYETYKRDFATTNAGSMTAAQRRRASGAYANLYGVDPIATGTQPYSDEVGGPVRQQNTYADSRWGMNNPVRLPPELVSYLDKNVGESWDEGLAGALDKVQLDTSRGGFGANYQRQTQALSDYLSQIDDPSVKQYAANLGGSMQPLADYAKAQEKATKGAQWKSGIQAASVLGGPLLAYAGGQLSSFLAPAVGETAAPIASSALINAGKGALSNAIMGGVMDDMPGSLGSSVTQSQPQAQVQPSIQQTSSSPLSESVTSFGSRRPLIRLSPGFRRGY